MKSEDLSEKWELPKKFLVSPEIIAQADKAQKEWASNVNSPFSIADGKTRERGLAIILIREYSEIGLNNLVTTQLLELAEAYATIGRYDEASEIAKKAKNTGLNKFYLQIWGAVWRPDNHWCNCEASHRFVEKDIWSIKHNEERPLLRCNHCGFVNVSDLPKSLGQQRQMRQQAREITQNLSPKEAKQRLETRNHTHDKLIGKLLT